MCPRSQSWRANWVTRAVWWDHRQVQWKRENKKCSWKDPRGRIKPPITPVSKRRACVFCYNPEKGAQTVLRSIFSKHLWCVHNKATAPFFFFSWSNVSIAICQEEPMNNNTSEETLGRFRKTRGDTHSHNHWGGKEREKSHSRMRKIRQVCIGVSEIVT